MNGKLSAGAADRKIGRWFKSRGWKVFSFQREVWAAYADGKSGLLHCTTGAGKTESQLEHRRLRSALEAMRESRLVLAEVETPTPFSFPIFVERFREQLSTEQLADRVSRMEVAIEKAGTRPMKSRPRKSASDA